MPTAGRRSLARLRLPSRATHDTWIFDIRRITWEGKKAAPGIFIALELPSPDMETEAVSAGFYLSPGWNQKYRRIQILSIFPGAKAFEPCETCPPVIR
jgi:hypothetical protein